ncbi:MAG: ATP-binding protein [Candidatus Azobacteroides sp.]|nr:ATP-binding protein [Candidatus Azobacteroides sp.]
MRLRGFFGIFILLVTAVLAVLLYNAFRAASFYLFLAAETLSGIAAAYLIVFYHRIIKPLQIIGDGMELLKEQDFGSRLRRVGQPEADRVVDIFNRMMEQLKNERLHIREQNQFMDLLIHASPLGVVILNFDERIVSANPAACKLFDLDLPEKIIGKSLKELDRPLASELIQIERNSSQVLRLSDANVYKCTHLSFIDKGFPHPFYLIETLTEEVFKAEKKAYEKVIRMIAHEVNNTTAGIASILDTLQSMENSKELNSILQIATERCYSMSRFISGFAEVVRIPEPQFREQDLNALVASCKHFMEMICRNHDIQIQMELSEKPLIVSIDSLLFEQVLVNIIKNSAEAIGQSGCVYIRTAHLPPSIEIADTGKGIDKETESKLFTPFFSTKPHGQGLGLMFIREVLLKHFCTFSLRTYPDGLTRFKIIFLSHGARGRSEKYLV